MFVAENTEYVTMFTRNDSQILLDDNNTYILLKKEIKQIMIISKEKKLKNINHQLNKNLIYVLLIHQERTKKNYGLV